MTILFSIALLVERLLEIIKDAFPVLKGRKGALWGISCFLGICLCLVFGADLFAVYGIEAAYPIVGPIVSGVICGVGSNFLHDMSVSLNGDKLSYMQTDLSGIAEELEDKWTIPDDEGVA